MRQLKRGIMWKMFLSYFYESAQGMVYIPRQHRESAREPLTMNTLVPRAWWQTGVIIHRPKCCAFGTVTEGFTALQTIFYQSLLEANLGSTTGWRRCCRPWPTQGKRWSCWMVAEAPEGPHCAADGC